MIYIKNIVLSFLATVGFAVLFHVPRETVVSSGITGVIQWMTYFLLEQWGVGVYLSYFLASFAAGVTGEIFARIQHKPALLYVVPGLIPLVPGSGIYYTMLYMVKKEPRMAFEKGVETLFLAIAIAAGVVISSVFSLSLRGRIKKDANIKKRKFNRT